MHSIIFQVSATPITEEEYINDEKAFNGQYMDYCGNPLARDKCIKSLLDLCHGAFRKDGDALTLIDSRPLIEIWQSGVDKAIERIKVTGIPNWGSRYDLQKALSCPLGSYLFFTDGEDNMTVGSDSFIEWITGNFVPGDKIYVGATLDYHF